MLAEYGTTMQTKKTMKVTCNSVIGKTMYRNSCYLLLFEIRQLRSLKVSFERFLFL